MTCETLNENGVAAIVCTRGQRARRCSHKGCTQKATILCDFKLPPRRKKTCDRALCRWHAVAQGPNVDFCGPHAVEGDRR